ncbi:hypothetical protein RUND412_000593 [Rhizina undulata]
MEDVNYSLEAKVNERRGKFKGGSYLIRKARIAHIDLLHQVNDMGRLIDDIKKKLREQKQMNQGRRKYPEGTSEA